MNNKAKFKKFQMLKPNRRYFSGEGASAERRGKGQQLLQPRQGE